MRLRTFLFWDLVGALMWIALIVGLGYAIGQDAVDVAHGVSHYALLITVGLVVAIVARQMWVGRRRAALTPAPLAEPEPEREPEVL
jgi:membrane protein DedA with SNARE-associated domain